MRGKLKLGLVITGASSVVASATAVVINVATGGTLPPVLEAYRPWSWPAVAVLTALSTVLGISMVRNGRSTDAPANKAYFYSTSHSPNSSPRSDTTSGPPNQLPPNLPDFTGRIRELIDLQELCNRGKTKISGAPNVVNIVGVSGIGKSSLATRLGHSLLEDCRFEAGAVFVDVQGSTSNPISAQQTLVIILRSLGIAPHEVPDNVQHRVGYYRTVLASKSILLVIDDAPPNFDVDILLPPNNRSIVVVTSRRPLLPSSARYYFLGTLDHEESAALVKKVAQIAGGSAAQWESLLEQCAGMPLALTLVGARLRGDRSLSPDTLARRLHDQGRFFTELSVESAAADKGIKEMYLALNPVARLSISKLAIVDIGTYDTYSASAILGIDITSGEQVIRELVEAQLLEPTGLAKYQMHRLIRLFCAQAISGPRYGIGKLRTKLRAVRWHTIVARECISMMFVSPATGAADQRVPDRLGGRLLLKVGGGIQMRCLLKKQGIKTSEDALAWLDENSRNLLIIAKYAGSASLYFYERILLSAITRYGQRTSDWEVESSALVQLHQSSASHRDRECQARSLLGLALLLDSDAMSDKALGLLQRSLDLWLRSDNGVGISATIDYIGVQYEELAEIDNAITCYRLVDKFAAGDLARVLSRELQGFAYVEAGRLAEARTVIESISTTDDLGAGRLAKAEGLARIDLAAGQVDSAVAILQDLVAERRKQNSHLAFRALNKLMDAFMQSGDTAKAIEVGESALVDATRWSFPVQHPHWSCRLAGVHTSAGRSTQAINLLASALTKYVLTAKWRLARETAEQLDAALAAHSDREPENHGEPRRLQKLLEALRNGKMSGDEIFALAGMQELAAEAERVRNFLAVADLDTTPVKTVETKLGQILESAPVRPFSAVLTQVNRYRLATAVIRMLLLIVPTVAALLFHAQETASPQLNWRSAGIAVGLGYAIFESSDYFKSRQIARAGIVGSLLGIIFEQIFYQAYPITYTSLEGSWHFPTISGLGVVCGAFLAYSIGLRAWQFRAALHRLRAVVSAVLWESRSGGFRTTE